MMRQNIFEKQKRQTPKMTFVFNLKEAKLLPFFYAVDYYRERFLLFK